ncbi:MAG: imidazole glycerol phosphate synthase subunit HisH [Patescibacteria group bacterium]
MKKVAIIDYGVGNMYSLHKALKKFSNAFITEEPEEMLTVDGIVLPGDGAFHAGMEGLRVRNLLDPLLARISEGIPILGICLGAQILLSKGFEFGESQGLDVIPGTVVKFPETANAKIPHINWSPIVAPSGVSWENTILEGIPLGAQVYFVHSFIIKPKNPVHLLATTTYGGTTFCSVVRKGSVYGCQFHPEKSGEVGLKIIENFLRV